MSRPALPTARAYAALLIPDAEDVTPGMFLRGLADALARHDGGDFAVRVARARAAAAGATVIARITRQPAGAEGARVIFEVAPRPGNASPDIGRAVAVLSDAVLRALRLVEANHVEWLRPGVALTPEEFIAAQSYTSRKRTPKGPPSVPPSGDDTEETERALSHLFRGDPSKTTDPAASGGPRNDTFGSGGRSRSVSDLRARSACWSLTALVASISPPVGLALSTLHAIRGADFRLSAHVLALSATGQLLMAQGLFDPVLSLALT